MSRPIAYNKPGAAINGSITNEDAVISYVVDGRGNDYYNNYESCTWVPSADGAAPIVFVTDTFTRGYEGDPNLAVPLFFACAGTSSASILYTANRLPGSPGNYTNANTALDELNRVYGYFILESNDPFEGINATSLGLDIDASKMTSYPQTGNNWYDLSGNGNTGALTNGPTFVLSSGSFLFDGIDDYVQVSNNNGFGTVGAAPVGTLSFTANLQRKSGGGIQFQQVAGFRNGGTFEFFFLLLDASGATVDTEARLRTTAGIYDINVGFTSYFDKWTRVDFVANSNRSDLYFNSNLVGSNTSVAGVFGATSGFFRVGLSPAGAYPTKGQVRDTSFYSRALSQADIKQNYFGAPIVTDGLVFAVDANNIVSYPKSGTSAYNLTSSNTLTLSNGLSYQPGNGGYFLSDGTDDGLATPDASNLDIAGNFTVEGWVWWNQHKDFGSLLVKGPGGAGNLFNYCFFFYASNIVCGFGDGSAFYNVSISTPPINTWHHIAGTYDGSNLRFYLNGVLAGTSAVTATPNQNSENLNVVQPDYPINGRVASARVYNRALSASEVLQNYQAEQYRFAGPQGLITNGLVVHLDAMNLDSYPGTGNTWFDLSGNGNNATRNGATGNPTWNQTNGWYFYASVNGVDGGLTIANSATIQNLTATTVFLVVAMETKTVISGDADWMAIYSKFAFDQRITISINQGVGFRYLHIEVPAVTDSAVNTFTNADYTGTKFNIMAARVGASGTTGWLNGSQISTSANTTTGNTVAIYLGHDVNNEMFKGSMKAVLTYNRALSDSEMGQVFTYLNSKFNVY